MAGPTKAVKDKQEAKRLVAVAQTADRELPLGRRLLPLILLILLPGVLWYVVKPREAKEEHAGEQLVKAAIKAGGGGEALLSYFPAEIPAGGGAALKQAGLARFFGKDNLWEYINGAAEGYLTMGFAALATRDYRAEGMREPVVADIFDMGEPVQALGMFAQERSPDYEFLPVGVRGFYAGTNLNFYKGKYYVKTVTYDESPAGRTRLIALAGQIATAIPEAGATPTELSWLPGQGRIADSEKFTATAYLGVSLANRVVSALYGGPDKPYEIFALAGKSNEHTEAIVKALQAELFDDTAGATLVSAGTFGGFVGQSEARSYAALVRSGRMIVGAHGAPDAGTAQAAVARAAQAVEAPLPGTEPATAPPAR